MEALKIGDLTVRVPIVQGGMGVAISLSGLATAVANAGGIGVISAAGIGMTEPNFAKDFHEANKTALKRHIRKVRENSNGVLGVNLMVALSDYDELLKVAIEEKVDIAIMGAGLPLKMPQFVLDKGFDNIHTKFAPKVSGGKAAKLIFNYWATKFNHVPDAVVVEGPKAGGHLGFKREQLEGEHVPLANLVKEVVAVLEEFEAKFNKKIPVIAAGGVYTGEDMKEMIDAGAKAVKLGTRFVTTHECDANIEFKNSYINSTADDMKLVNSPVGLPGRVVNGPFVEKVFRNETSPFSCPWKCLKSCDYTKAPYCISNILLQASKGRLDRGFAFAGTNAHRATKIESVQEVIDDVINGYKKLSTKSNASIRITTKEKLAV